MTQFQDLLRKENGNVSIIAINMDMPEFRFLAEKNQSTGQAGWKEIYDYIIKHLKKNVINYKKNKRNRLANKVRKLSAN